MAANHLVLGFTFGLSLSVISWMVGIMGGALLVRSRHVERLSHLNFIPSKALNSALGIHQFKWAVKNSLFRFLNQSIRVDGQRTDLAAIRHQMTIAEINHLIGVLFVAAAAGYQGLNVSPVFGVSMMIPNLFLNRYPSLARSLVDTGVHVLGTGPDRVTWGFSPPSCDRGARTEASPSERSDWPPACSSAGCFWSTTLGFTNVASRHTHQRSNP